MDRLAAAEAAFLAAREAWDRHGIAIARGLEDTEASAASAAELTDRAREALELAPKPRDGEARRALATMRTRIGSFGAAEGDEDANGLYGAFTAASQALVVDGEPIQRLAILGRLARADDPGRRRELFLALEPLWRAVDGDGGAESPYRALIRRAAARYAVEPSPYEVSAAALGIDPTAIEGWSLAILEAWRDAIGDAPLIEPWDWWWAAGEAERELTPRIPLVDLLRIADRHASGLGADLGRLGIGFDVHPRPGRPPVPVAYTEFGGRPHRTPTGDSAGEPWVFASYTQGGLGELTELIHEVGHAIHIAAIRARPAFADWPDSDAFTEALAEVLALDTAEPEWQRRHLGRSVSERVAIRGRYADVAMDAAWALFEIRMVAGPEQRPNDVWTAITGEFLRIAPHPEWSWWAIRGQLASDPGYMANYAVGAVLAADLRWGLRQVHGDWLERPRRWYRAASEWLFRFGLERSSRDVIHGLLGRPPDPRAVVAEIARMR